MNYSDVLRATKIEVCDQPSKEELNGDPSHFQDECASRPTQVKLSSLRKFLKHETRFSDKDPVWVKMIAIGRFLGVDPWELEHAPLEWVERVAACMDAYSWAQEDMRKNPDD